MHEEAALALGATRWEMIRMAVLPFGRSGIISASMLGLAARSARPSRSPLVLSATFDITLNILEPGGNTIAANIANAFGEADADRPGRADRLRPGAVRHHAARQHRRPR